MSLDKHLSSFQKELRNICPDRKYESHYCTILILITLLFLRNMLNSITYRFQYGQSSTFAHVHTVTAQTKYSRYSLEAIA